MHWCLQDTIFVDVLVLQAAQTVAETCAQGAAHAYSWPVSIAVCPWGCRNWRGEAEQQDHTCSWKNWTRGVAGITIRGFKLRCVASLRKVQHWIRWGQRTHICWSTGLRVQIAAYQPVRSEPVQELSGCCMPSSVCWWALEQMIDASDTMLAPSTTNMLILFTKPLSDLCILAHTLSSLVWLIYADRWFGME